MQVNGQLILHLPKLQLSSSSSIRKFKQNFGENLFYASAIKWDSEKTQAQQMTPKTVVDAWISEKANYNHVNNRCAPGKVCSHYTQVVWKNSTEVGCAKAYCSNNSQV